MRQRHRALGVSFRFTITRIACNCRGPTWPAAFNFASSRRVNCPIDLRGGEREPEVIARGDRRRCAKCNYNTGVELCASCGRRRLHFWQSVWKPVISPLTNQLTRYRRYHSRARFRKLLVQSAEVIGYTTTARSLRN